MYKNINTPFGRGYTYFRGEVPASTTWKKSAAIEGILGEFIDKKPRSSADTVGVQQVREPRPQVCRAVRNSATIALKPGRATVWASGYRNKRVDGYQATQYGEIAGIVDEHLPAAGAAVGDIFWLVVEGEVLATGDGNTTAIAAGALINAASGTSSLNDDAGRIEATAITAGDTQTAFGAEHYLAGRAVSAKLTTDATNKRLLCDIKLL